MPIPNCLHETYEKDLLPPVTDVLLPPGLEGAREGALAMLAFGGAAEAGVAAHAAFVPALGPEGYEIDCSEAGVEVRAGGESAAVYAAATLRQLAAEHGGRLPACRIADAPRFGWRGLTLDACRHFFPIGTIYHLVDLMAYYKYNRLHLHLSDDQGFRFESERYPLLNSVGSYRASTLEKRGGKVGQNGVHHGGYYRKHELVKLVRYAKARGIEIVPELDLPGHAVAILAAYPALACRMEPLEVATYFGVSDFSRKLFCAGSDETFAFLCSLLDELMEAFPYEYVHIGGDEAVKTEWKHCPRCRRVMAAQGLGSERELQGYLLNRVLSYLKERGRRAIVWNDGLCKNLDPGAVVQFWTPLFFERARTVRRVNAGGEAIMSRVFNVYYDYPYAFTPLWKTYRYEPVLRGIRPEAEKNVLGVEAAIWTEWIDTEEKLFFNTLPRLAATAETGWSAKDGKRYSDFLRRLAPHYALYAALGLNYARFAENPLSAWQRLGGALTFLTRDTHAELLQNQTGGPNGRRNQKKDN